MSFDSDGHRKQLRFLLLQKSAGGLRQTSPQSAVSSKSPGNAGAAALRTPLGEATPPTDCVSAETLLHSASGGCLRAEVGAPSSPLQRNQPAATAGVESLLCCACWPFPGPFRRNHLWPLTGPVIDQYQGPAFTGEDIES